MSILQEEASLNEIVQLVGKDSLSPRRPAHPGDRQDDPEDFLQQNAFVDIDSFSDYRRRP